MAKSSKVLLYVALLYILCNKVVVNGDHIKQLSYVDCLNGCSCNHTDAVCSNLEEALASVALQKRTVTLLQKLPCRDRSLRELIQLSNKRDVTIVFRCYGSKEYMNPKRKNGLELKSNIETARR
ncbi:hypothetical protein TrispH2_008876, partial [Trichoplax sp. H2]